MASTLTHLAAMRVIMVGDRRPRRATPRSRPDPNAAGGQDVADRGRARQSSQLAYLYALAVGCHLGSDEDDLGRLAKRLDTDTNFAIDTAARFRYFARGDRERVREFLKRYQERVLYATDFALREGDSAAAARSLRPAHDRDWAFFSGGDAIDYDGRPTRGLALPEGVLRKIFRENALRWIPGLRA